MENGMEDNIEKKEVDIMRHNIPVYLK